MMKCELLQVLPHGCGRFLLGGHTHRERKRQRVTCSKRFGEMERSCFLLLHNMELIFFSRMFEEFTNECAPVFPQETTLIQGVASRQ